MNRIIITAAAMLLAAPAFAQVNIGSGTQAASDAAAKAQQQQGLTNAPVTVIESSPIPTTTTIKNTPSLAIGGPASGPCNGFSGGIMAGWAGFGGGANFSKVDEGCEERETARIAALMGRMDIANLVLEEMDVVKRAKERRAAAQQQPAKKADVAPAPVAQQARPQLVAATTQMTPSEQTRNICEQAKLTGDNILAARLNCPK